MNVERLHFVARAVAEELASLDLVGVVGRLRNGLQAMANNPSDAAAQQEISEARIQLATLADAPSNGWPPTDRQILDELGVSDILGERLLERIEDILARNDMTPSVAVNEIAPIHDRLTEVTQHLSELLGAFGFFEISRDDLVDNYEVGVAIPRGAVNNRLPNLGEEFVELQQILSPFEEVAGQGRPDFVVGSIASSDFNVFLLAAPEVVLVIAQTVKVIVETYETILDIKRKRAELADLITESPDDKLAEIDAYANARMAERLTALAEEIVDASALKDEHRKHELKIDVNWSLNRLANRIDGGYSIDIRTPPPPDEVAEEEEENAERARILEIRELSARISRLEVGGSRILELPEGPGGGDDESTEPPK
jgi:hypothetical protein